MDSSSKRKPFTGSLKARFKKILGTSDKASNPSAGAYTSEPSPILPEFEWSPYVPDHSPSFRPHAQTLSPARVGSAYTFSKPPPYDASNSNNSLANASSSTRGRLDSLHFATLPRKQPASFANDAKRDDPRCSKHAARATGAVLQSSRAINSTPGSPKVSELIANFEALAAGCDTSAGDPSLFRSPPTSSDNQLSSRVRRISKRSDVDESKVRVLEARIADLERECEDQRELIAELQEENEVFYSRLREISRQNKKLKKRINESPPVTSDESDYGEELPSALSRFSDTSEGITESDMETMRSDMLARPHGVYNWNSDNSSSVLFYPQAP